jgi:arginyl-tRNA synthetase
VDKAMTDLNLSTVGLSYKLTIERCENPLFGDFSSNAALILAKQNNIAPKVLAEKIIEKIDKSAFEKVEIAGPGFINFFPKAGELISELGTVLKKGIEKEEKKDEKVLVEYFQPNIAKPLHVGHLRTAIIGDSLKRIFLALGFKAESDTHIGDWGTQFGLLLLAYKKYGDDAQVAKDPITELNKLYVRINEEIEKEPKLKDDGKQEFVKLEQGDEENRKIWKKFVEWSMEKFSKINELMDILPFDHNWPESFYEDKMRSVVLELEKSGLLKESQGAKIVDLSAQNLGIAIIIKSDGGTTYLLRDLATFIYRKNLGFKKQLYVVDVRQKHAFEQLFAILKMMGLYEEGEGVHIDYGFISFKGETLSTRKGNMVLAEDLVSQAEEKVKKIIAEKNPDLAGKEDAAKVVAKGAIKFFDLSHNRNSDIEFDWERALDFEGKSGPYLQYSYARLSSILRKEKFTPSASQPVDITPTERLLMLEIAMFEDVVQESAEQYLPSILANYLYNLASLVNKFYHESPVIKEADLSKKQFRLNLVIAGREVLKKGLDLLGIKTLEEM